jgi:hypothetical protein
MHAFMVLASRGPSNSAGKEVRRGGENFEPTRKANWR